MDTAIVRVQGLTTGTLNQIDGLSDDIRVEWPDEGDTDSCPQIVGRFHDVDDHVVVLKWKRSRAAESGDKEGGDGDDGRKPERGLLGIPLHHVEAIISVKG